MKNCDNAPPTRRFEVIEAFSLDQNLISVWEGIRANDSAYTHPHFSPHFVVAAARSIPNVKVAVVYDNDSPVGFFPFQHTGQVGWPAAYPFNETHGLVHRPDLEIEAKELCREAGLGAWHFDHLPSEQQWSQPYQRAYDDAAWIELPEDHEAYLESRRASGTSQLKQADRKRRKVAREVGPVRYVDQIRDPKAIESLIAWKHTQTLGSKSGKVFESDHTKTLLSDILAIEQPNVSGKLSGLYAGDRLIALHLGMRCRSTYVSMIPAHDPEFAAYSPGLILHLEMIQVACEQSVTDIDLGRGINRVKAALMTSTRKLAIGSIDCRPFRKLATNSWYWLRSYAHSSKVGNRLLMLRRQLKLCK